MIELKEMREIAITILIAAYHLFLTVFTMLWIFTNCFSCWKLHLGVISTFNVNEHVTLGLFFAGVLGGSFYCLRALYRRLADAYAPSDPKKELVPLKMSVWAFWYLYRPLQGGILALILLVLTKSSLLKLQDLGDADTSSYYTLIGIGFLAGFGAHEVIEKIEAVIKVIFASSGSSDGQRGAGNKVVPNNPANPAPTGDAPANPAAGQGKTAEGNTQDTDTPAEDESDEGSTEENSPTEPPKEK